MPIIYPSAQAATTEAITNLKYSFNFLSPEQGPTIVTGSAYTASFGTSAYIIQVHPDVASGSTINVEVPNVSGFSQGGNFPINSSLGFIRVDTKSDVTVRLVTNTSSAGFFSGSLSVTASSFSIPTASNNLIIYNNDSNPAPGNSPGIKYFVLQSSPLPTF